MNTTSKSQQSDVRTADAQGVAQLILKSHAQGRRRKAMTDDLVKRLRSNRPIPTLPHEAADRIEALTAENEALKKSGRALLNAKHKEAAEAMLWFEEGQALTAENERLRKALGAVPLISAQEGLAAFKSRQDEWLRTEYRAAHHPECEDATGAYPGSCTCAAIKRREALDNLFASDADLIDVEENNHD
jgi:choline dehydrogenase-like flavoprotein